MPQEGLYECVDFFHRPPLALSPEGGWPVSVFGWPVFSTFFLCPLQEFFGGLYYWSRREGCYTLSIALAAGRGRMKCIRAWRAGKVFLYDDVFCSKGPFFHGAGACHINRWHTHGDCHVYRAAVNADE